MIKKIRRISISYIGVSVPLNFYPVFLIIIYPLPYLFVYSHSNRTEIECQEKQTILYGNSRVPERSYKRKSIYNLKNLQNYLGYCPDGSPGNRQSPPVSELRAYIEKYWETSATKKDDKQSETNLLKKYGGIQFKDDNYGIIYTIGPSA